MPGTAMSVGAVAVTAALTVGFVTAGAGAAFSQRLAGVADAAALAAADAASGAVAGAPCDRAGEVAEANGVSLAACEVDVLTATVTVTARFAGLAATAVARAGPPQ